MMGPWSQRGARSGTLLRVASAEEPQVDWFDDFVAVTSVVSLGRADLTGHLLGRGAEKR